MINILSCLGNRSVVCLLLLLLGIGQGFGSETTIGSTKVDLNGAFSNGREIFYETLRYNSSSLPLEAEDLRLLRKPERRIRGLYEHLMGFYYYSGLLKVRSESILHAQIPALSSQMAYEFLDSIRESRKTDTLSKLHAVLSSAGYHTRNSAPSFRRFLRPLARQLKTQWALEETHVREAQKVTKGEKIRLAIVDSGVDPTVKEIKSQIVLWRNFLDGSVPLGRNGRVPYDWDGHGTSIASVIVQVAPEVEVMVIKVFDMETMSDVPLSRWNVYLVVAGLFWAVQNGADIISLSLALKSDFELLRETAEFCWENNTVLVTCLGNVYGNDGQITGYFPAAYDTTIAVGGVEKINERLKVWRYSGKGEYIDIVAPAAGIWVELPSYLPKRQWPRQVAGNSLAVPVAAGAAAMILSSMTAEIRHSLTSTPGLLVETVRTVLRRSSSNEKLGLETPNSSSGFGLIDIRRAIDIARNLKTPDSHD